MAQTNAAGHARTEPVPSLAIVQLPANAFGFLLQDDNSILIYKMVNANRINHVVDRPQVALHFDGDGTGRFHRPARSEMAAQYACGPPTRRSADQARR